MVRILWWVIVIGIAAFTVYIGRDLWKHRDELRFKGRSLKLSIIAFICMFGDTIGIGSFATYSSSWKFTKSVDDSKIPGTLNAGTGICTALEAVFFLGDSEVDELTCITMVIAAVAGALIGSKLVCRMNVKMIRYGMGIAMLVLGTILVMKNAGIGPFGVVGTEIGVRGAKLAIGIAVNFVLGALMMIGVGLYAPCMALVSLLGMNVGVAFPIMMGSCACLMLAGGVNFVKEGKYDRTASIVSTLVGAVGVYCAFRFVKSLSITTLMWVVIAVMFVTAVIFLRDARRTAPVEEEKENNVVVGELETATK